MANEQFRLAMEKWATKSVPDAMLGVARIAIQDTAEDVVDLTPVDTGFLVGNWQAALGAPDVSLMLGASGYDPSSVSAVIEELKLGDVFFFSNNAVYARRINYGFVGPDSLGRVYNQAGRHMIEIAISRWETNVEEAANTMGLQ